MTGNTNHPNPSTWERLACGELPPDEESKAREHIANCPDCGATWDALRDVRSAAETFDPYFQAPEPAAALFGVPRRHVALAVAAVLAAALGLTLFQHMGFLPKPTPAAPSLEAPGAEGIDRAGSSTQLEPRIPAEGTAGSVTAFSWQGSPADDNYAVDLLDGNGALLWQSERLAGHRIPWPDQIEKAPGIYYWRVVAYQNGQSASSDLVRFELDPESTPTARTLALSP